MAEVMAELDAECDVLLDADDELVGLVKDVKDVSSFFLPATCVQRVGDPQRMHPTDAALMTSVTTWSSSAPLRS
jgi:hypothetical protein